MKHKYGKFTSLQIHEVKMLMRKDIFFLLLCVDPKTKQEYKEINVNKTFENIMLKISGLNQLLFCPPELVTILSFLEQAMVEYNNPDFEFRRYRKLILDAGSEVLKIKEVGDDA